MSCPRCNARPKFGMKNEWVCDSFSAGDFVEGDLCRERQRHAETRRKLEESDAACRAAESRSREVYQWIERHSQDGFIDSKSVTANLDLIFDSLFERYDEARHKLQKLERVVIFRRHDSVEDFVEMEESK